MSIFSNMILGFLLTDSFGFIKFEYYLPQLFEIVPRNEFFDFLNNTNYTEGKYEYKSIGVNICQIDTKTGVGIIYNKNKPPTDKTIEFMKKLSLKIAKGDKMAIHMVLQANSPADFIPI